MKQLAIILIGLLFLISCDCYQEVSGTILDSKTKNPLEGITVYNKDKPTNKKETDKDGKFELSSISGGLWRCPPMIVTIKDSNYQTKEVEISTGDDLTIEIEKKTCNTTHK